MREGLVKHRQLIGTATLVLLAAVFVHASNANYSVLEALAICGIVTFLPNALPRPLHWLLRLASLLGQVGVLLFALTIALTVTFMADGGRTGWQGMQLWDWTSTWGVIVLGGASTAATLLDWITARPEAS